MLTLWQILWRERCDTWESLYIQAAIAKHMQPAERLFAMCILWNAVYRITYAHRCYIHSALIRSQIVRPRVTYTYSMPQRKASITK